MWPGVVAGLALLPLSLVRLAHAQNVTVNDQQLLYDGEGWGTFVGSQACTDISTTVHSTSNSGDRVSYSFNGDGVFVHGPISGSNSMTIFLDGILQTVSPAVQDDSGCGILYSNPNIPNVNGQQHTLIMVAGSSSLGISGITTSASNTVPSVAPVSMPTTTLQMIVTPVSLQSVPPTSSPTSTSSLTSTNSASSSTTTPAVVGAAAGAGPTSSLGNSTKSGASATESVINTTTFETTPAMTAGVIAAIVGTIVGMIALLGVFLLIRRRITRQTARKLDRYQRDIEQGKGKAKALIQDEQSPVWTDKKPESAPYGLGRNNPMSSGQGSVVDVIAAAALPHPTASSPASQSVTSPISPARSRISKHASHSPTYAVNLGSALLSSPQAAMDTPPDIRHKPPDARHAPAALIIPRSPESPVARGPETAGSSGLSQRTAPPPFSSAAATWSANVDEKMPTAYVVNRSESVGSSQSARTGQPPPGYF